MRTVASMVELKVRFGWAACKISWPRRSLSACAAYDDSVLSLLFSATLLLKRMCHLSIYMISAI